MADIILLLAVFVGSVVIAYALITRVPPKLHTPLMSMTNAISGITILAAVLVFSYAPRSWEAVLGGLALIAVSFNVFGGFVLTHRILRMFRE
jgi:NAD(P) transhydrogenase subunit alpha